MFIIKMSILSTSQSLSPEASTSSLPLFEKLTFDVRNPTCFTVWAGIFFPQIVGLPYVASGYPTTLPLLISNSPDLQLNDMSTKNAKVK